MKRKLFIIVLSFMLLTIGVQKRCYAQQYATFSPISTTPLSGIVNEIPNGIVIGFPAEVGKFSADKVYLVDSDGNSVRTMKAQWLDESEYVVGAPFYKHGKDIYEFVKFVFTGSKTAAVKATGNYHFTVPEGMIWNNEYDATAEDEGISAGARFNPVFTIEYMIQDIDYPSEITFSDQTLQVYTKSSNEAASYSLDEFDKITFSEKGIQIWNTQWPTEYSYANVRVLTFNGTSGGSFPDVLQHVTERSEGSQIFDLQGRKLNSLKRGVNIIRMKDGSTRKVLLK